MCMHELNHDMLQHLLHFCYFLSVQQVCMVILFGMCNRFHSLIFCIHPGVYCYQKSILFLCSIRPQLLGCVTLLLLISRRSGILLKIYIPSKLIDYFTEERRWEYVAKWFSAVFLTPSDQFPNVQRLSFWNEIKIPSVQPFSEDLKELTDILFIYGVLMLNKLLPLINTKKQIQNMQRLIRHTYWHVIRVFNMSLFYLNLCTLSLMIGNSSQQNGLESKVEKSRKQMKERKNRAKKIRGVKKVGYCSLQIFLKFVTSTFVLTLL